MGNGNGNHSRPMSRQDSPFEEVICPRSFSRNEDQEIEVQNYEDRLEPDEGGFVGDEDPWRTSISRQGSLGSRQFLKRKAMEDDYDHDQIYQD